MRVVKAHFGVGSILFDLPMAGCINVVPRRRFISLGVGYFVLYIVLLGKYEENKQYHNILQCIFSVARPAIAYLGRLNLLTSHFNNLES